MFGRIAKVAGKVVGAAAVAVMVSSGAAPVAAELHNLDQVVINTAPVINDFWASYFEEEGIEYRMPELNYYNTPQNPGTTMRGCGKLPLDNAIYCPMDKDIYLDYQFLNEQIDEFGDASVAMVIAHEWGHHVFSTMGHRITMDGELDSENEFYSIQGELRADCYAGVSMANFEELGMLEDGDIDEVYDITLEFGDSPGTRPTEPGAHGEGKLRKAVLKAGYRSGDPGDCEAIVEKNLKGVL